MMANETRKVFYLLLWTDKDDNKQFAIFDNMDKCLIYQSDFEINGRIESFDTRVEARNRAKEWINSEDQIPVLVKAAKSKGEFAGSYAYQKINKIFEEPKSESIGYEKLSTSQKDSYTTLMTGYNCFLTGMAGTGKSTLIQKFISDSEANNKTVVVTGSTGISSQNIGGVTIHKALGIPWNDPDKLLRKDWREVKPQVKSLLRCSDIIIIDEISMVDYVTFEYIVALIEHSNVNRKKRGKAKTQLVVVGDFLQLPPVIKEKELVYKRYYPGYGEGWCFNSDAWKRMNFKTLHLTEVVRQSESEYIDALNALKVGDKSVKDYFNQRFCSPDEIPEDAIHLYGTNEAVNRRNISELDKVKGAPYSVKTRVDIEPGFTGKLDLWYPDFLNFKIGCRVMTTSNGDVYQNGSIGTVQSIRQSSNGEIEEIAIKFDNGKIGRIHKEPEEHYSYDVVFDREVDDFVVQKTLRYTEYNFPLKLAYAITIHKSQGQTFDKVVIEPTCFANGQLYVALSRCKTLEGIYLLKIIEDADVMASNEVIYFLKQRNLL